jgi:hypothetical protein
MSFMRGRKTSAQLESLSLEISSLPVRKAVAPTSRTLIEELSILLLIAPASMWRLVVSLAGLPYGVMFASPMLTVGTISEALV